MRNNGNARPDVPPVSQEPERRPLALTQWDWLATGLLCLVLLLAPLGAATFSTPSHTPFAGPAGLLDTLQSYGIPLTFGLTGLALLLMVWREWQRPVAIGNVPGLSGALLLLAGWAALSLTRATNVLALSVNALGALLTALALGGMVARFSRSDRGLCAFLLTVAGAGSLIGALGVNEYLTFWRQGDAIHRTFATFVNPDFAAGYLLLTVPLTLACFAATRDRLVQGTLGVGLMLQCACLVSTGSRTACFALLFALLLWLFLTFWVGVKRWPQIALGLALALLGALPAARPITSRFDPTVQTAAAVPTIASGSAASSTPAAAKAPPAALPVSNGGHSGNFRRYTWIGAMNIVRANPLLGTGIGTFKNAYPRYAITAYTFHAHNTFLQWTSETGVPGVLLLLTALAAACAFAFAVLRTLRTARAGAAEDEELVMPPITTVGLFDEPRLILAALLTALLASMIKSLLADSDWYLVATLLTVSATTALMTALARTLTPLATQIPRPLSHGMLAGCALVALLLLARASMLENAQLGWTKAGSSQSPSDILAGYQAAASADPLDPDARLALASAYRRLQQPDEEEKALQAAIQAAQTGETYYRLGQFYSAANQPDKAIKALENAREHEPHNVQTLRALGEAYQKAGQTEQAKQMFLQETDLEKTPYGTVRAVPEMPEIEFAYAHARLAELAETAHDDAEAMRQYEAAYLILQEYWSRRTFGINSLSPDKREKVATLYEDVLTHWLAAAQRQKAPSAAAIAALLPQVQAEHNKDREAQAAATGGGTQ